MQQSYYELMKHTIQSILKDNWKRNKKKNINKKNN